MSSSPDGTLVVLTGPVGGGKSTVAQELAEQLREAGRTAAVIDLDDLYLMAAQVDHFGDEDTWRTARSGAAALADRFFDRGLGVVIVEGGFFTAHELAGLEDELASAPRRYFFTLMVSYDETLRRVTNDPAPDRVLSRDPNILKRLHDNFVAALPYLESASTVIDANHDDGTAIARTIRGSAP